MYSSQFFALIFYCEALSFELLTLGPYALISKVCTGQLNSCTNQRNSFLFVTVVVLYSKNCVKRGINALNATSRQSCGTDDCRS